MAYHLAPYLAPFFSDSLNRQRTCIFQSHYRLIYAPDQRIQSTYAVSVKKMLGSDTDMDQRHGYHEAC